MRHLSCLDGSVLAKDTTRKDTVMVQMTPADITALIGGEWIETIVENTRDLPPYSLVTFRTDKELIHMTPTDVVKLIKQKTDKDVNTKEHWFETVITNTKDIPYLLTFKAHRR